ncbi:MAG: hypothetical protein AAGA87_01800 [Pseudomonadota bacterium]
MTPTVYLAAHGTTRWHNNPVVPAQTVADHCAGVARFVLWLKPYPSPGLILEALHHDDGEGVVGDIPGPAKREFPKLRDWYEYYEHIARVGMRSPTAKSLSDEERKVLRIADWLEAITFANYFGRPGLLERQDWKDQCWAVVNMAEELDDEIGSKVRKWIQEITS